MKAYETAEARTNLFKKTPLAAAPSLLSPWLGAAVSNPTGWWVQWHLEWDSTGCGMRPRSQQS